MSKQSEQIIDLEGLANHKGSAFGGLGEGAHGIGIGQHGYLYLLRQCYFVLLHCL